MTLTATASGTVKDISTVEVIVPTLACHAERAQAVVNACREVGLDSCVVMQEGTDVVASATRTVHHPTRVGKGGAVRSALSDRPVLVHDADLRPNPDWIRDAASLAAQGQWVRPSWGVGRLSARIPDLAQVLGVPVDLSPLAQGGLLSGIAAYPADLLPVVWQAAVRFPGYGFDLEVALHLLQQERERLQVLPGMEREHLPGGTDHLQSMLLNNVEVLGRWAQW